MAELPEHVLLQCPRHPGLGGDPDEALARGQLQRLQRLEQRRRVGGAIVATAAAIFALSASLAGLLRRRSTAAGSERG